jgi:hypothetical protein
MIKWLNIVFKIGIQGSHFALVMIDASPE